MTERPLTATAVASFRDKGFTILRNAVPGSVCHTARQEILQHVTALGHDLNRPDHHEICCDYKLPNHLRGSVLTERLDGAMRQLFDPYPFELPEEIGLAPVRVPLAPTENVRGLITGWHIDGPGFHHRIDSIEQALIILVLLTDVDQKTGGTRLRTGSHRIVAEVLAGVPAGLSCQDAISAALPGSRDCPVETALGAAGDAVLMHGMLVHAGSINRGAAPRVMLNMSAAWAASLPDEGSEQHPLYGPVGTALHNTTTSTGVST